MSGFERVKGSDRGMDERTISSITVVSGDLLAFDRSNAVDVLATSSSSAEDVSYVATAAATSADTEVLAQQIIAKDRYRVDSANNSNSAHNNQRMVLTDENTVNNTGTDSTADTAVVMQVGVVGAASDKKIIVEFVTRQDRA